MSTAGMSLSAEPCPAYELRCQPLAGSIPSELEPYAHNHVELAFAPTFHLASRTINPVDETCGGLPGVARRQHKCKLPLC